MNYYKEKKDFYDNRPFKYRLTYVGRCTYQLTKGKYKVLYHTCNFSSMYDFIKKNNIDFSEVHLPYMTLNDFFRDWACFDDERRRL